MLDNMIFNDIYSMESFTEAANNLMRSIKRINISEDDAKDIVDNLFMILDDYLKSNPKAEDLKNMMEELDGLKKRKYINRYMKDVDNRHANHLLSIYNAVMNLFSLDHIEDSDSKAKSILHDISASLFEKNRNFAKFSWMTLIANYNLLSLIMKNKHKRIKFIESLSEKANSPINFKANYAILLYGICRVRNAIVRKFNDRVEIHYMLNLLIVSSSYIFFAAGE